MSKTFYFYIQRRFVNRPLVYKRESELNDKITVRKHLSKITDKLPTAYFTGNIKNCDFSKLPQNYIIKPRCMCIGKGITFVRNGIDTKTGKPVNVNNIKNFYIRFKSNRGSGNHVIIEEYLFDVGSDGNEKTINDEYKFFIFGGKVQIISVIRDINTPRHLKIDHDLNWNRVRMHNCRAAPLDIKVEKPENLNDMIEFAEKVANYYHQYTKIPFVRVDLYNIDTKDGKRIFFGEFTGGPNGGKGITQEYQQLFGKYWSKSIKK